MAALGLSIACSEDESEPELVINLAIVQSLTGSGEVYGRSAVEGVELAIEELEDANPEIRFEYSVVDDDSDPETSLEAYRDLVEGDVTAIIGPTFSSIGLDVLKVAQDAGIPAISPITTAAGITDVGDYVFRIALAEEASLPPLVEFVSERSPIEKALILLHSGDAYSRSARDAMRVGLEAAGVSEVIEIDVATTPNLPEVLARPAIRDADAVLLPLLLEDAVPALAALQAAGYEQPVIGGEAMASASLIDLAGDSVDGVYVSATWHPDLDSDLSRAFVEASRDEYGETPEYYAAASHAAIHVLADAVTRAGSTDHAAVRDAIAATDGLETVLGPLSISEEGDAVFQPVFQRFEGGSLELLR